MGTTPTAFHDFTVDIGLQALLQRRLPFDIALNRRERLKPLRDVLAFLGAHLLDQLAAIEGTETGFLLVRQELSFPPVKQKVVELVNVHLIGDVDLCVLVGFDAGDAFIGVDETSDALLHVRKQLLSMKQQALSVLLVLDRGGEHELPKIDIHEELGQQRVDVASVG